MSRGGHAHPKTWPADRERRARIIGELLQTEALFLARAPNRSEGGLPIWLVQRTRPDQIACRNGRP